MNKYIILSIFVLCGSATVASAQSYSFDRDLSVGSSGNDVSNLQIWLMANGYDIPAIRINAGAKGYFGLQTRAAVIAYQRARGIPAYGFFGSLSRRHFRDNDADDKHAPNAPVIKVVTGPSTVALNQTGTWTISASDLQNSQLSYSVTWGDEPVYRGQNSNIAVASPAFIQNTTFTHEYSTAGTYTIVFTVRNAQGLSATKSTTVNAGNVATPITVTSPNGGETWVRGTTQNITWTAPAYFRATYVDINLVTYYPPCPNLVPCPYPATYIYSLANNIPANQGLQSYVVGNFDQNNSNSNTRLSISDGQYIVQICETGKTGILNCDWSDKPLTITSNDQTGNKPPVINGLDAPTTLIVGQTGTWTVRASDPENGTLSYVVDWGDVSPVVFPAGMSGYQMQPQYVQSPSFTHSYSKAGTYTVMFVVADSSGLTAQTKTTVVVTNTQVTSGITVVSPNGGEVWPAKSTHLIAWNSSGTNSYVDLYLLSANPCPVSTVEHACEQRIINLDKNISINTSYNWIVATDTSNQPIPSGMYRVEVCSAGAMTNCDSSDGAFTIY